ncbi:class I SAM-dependent methyltransferase [Sphingomonas sp. PB4P5]|uniref:class I SAM-dependent methyltransferase n=1 Tax=Parasphingomonas puruogangriensis TaxID=3096155 RepID=UPI002FC90CF2
MANSDRNWEIWGERDPYYAVLTEPDFRGGMIEANKPAFFASGDAYITSMIALLERHFGNLPRDRALDFGCGVGRLTVPLSDTFASVVGLDISSAMLREARLNSQGRAIEYLHSDDTLSRVEGSFDLVNSSIVLQHIPVNRGMRILRNLLERVRLGGGCLIHISIKRRRSKLSELRYRLRHSLPGGQALLNVLAGEARDTPVMEMNEYPLSDVLRLFHQLGFEDLLVRYGDHGGVDTVLLLARRGGVVPP